MEACTHGVDASTCGVEGCTRGMEARTRGMDRCTHGGKAWTRGMEAGARGKGACTHGVEASTRGVEACTRGMEARTCGMERVRAKRTPALTEWKRGLTASVGGLPKIPPSGQLKDPPSWSRDEGGSSCKN